MRVLIADRPQTRVNCTPRSATIAFGKPPSAAVASSFAFPSTHRKVALSHRQCAWCLRLKHDDGRPHGKPWHSVLPGYSHGICTECLASAISQTFAQGSRRAA